MAIRQIEEQTGVDRREIYRLVDRCTKVHEDGRAFGYRALVSYARVAGYQRVARVRIAGTGGSRGTAGMKSLFAPLDCEALPVFGFASENR